MFSENSTNDQANIVKANDKEAVLFSQNSNENKIDNNQISQTDPVKDADEDVDQIQSSKVETQNEVISDGPYAQNAGLQNDEIMEDNNEKEVVGTLDMNKEA